MLKKGIAAKDLRPFSMDDPYGLGVVSPTQQRLRQRFHRKGHKRKPAPVNDAQVAGALAREVMRQVTTERRQPPPPPRAAPSRSTAQSAASPNTEKKKSGGCLTTLVVIGVLYGLGSVFVPPIVNAIEQKIVIETGNSAHARIISSNETTTEIMEETVYDLVVEMRIPGYDPYQIEFSQALPVEQSRHLAPDVWAEVRYDPDDLTSIAIVSVGVPNPTLDQAEGSPIDRLQKIQEMLDAKKNAPRAIPGDVVAPADPRPRTEDRPAAEPEAPIGAGREPNEPAAKSTPEADAAQPEPSQPKKAPESAKEPNPGANPSAPKPQPVAEPQPAAKKGADATPAKPAPHQPTLVCAQAAACCKIAGGGSCSRFTKPNVKDTGCRNNLRRFSKMAEKVGKSCSGF